MVRTSGLASHRRSGFTLVELLIVVGITVVLSGGLEAYLRASRDDLERHQLHDRWRQRAGATLQLLARDVRSSPSEPVVTAATLELTTRDGRSLRYEHGGSDCPGCVWRVIEGGPMVVLATDVSVFEVERAKQLVEVRLELSTTIRGVHVTASHASAIALTSRPVPGTRP